MSATAASKRPFSRYDDDDELDDDDGGGSRKILCLAPTATLATAFSVG